MKVFKKQNTSKKILQEILDTLKDIHSVLTDEQDENKKMQWLLLSQDNDIRKLKEKNKELKKQNKEMSK